MLVGYCLCLPNFPWCRPRDWCRTNLVFNSAGTLPFLLQGINISDTLLSLSLCKIKLIPCWVPPSWLLSMVSFLLTAVDCRRTWLLTAHCWSITTVTYMYMYMYVVHSHCLFWDRTASVAAWCSSASSVLKCYNYGRSHADRWTSVHCLRRFDLLSGLPQDMCFIHYWYQTHYIYTQKLVHNDCFLGKPVAVMSVGQNSTLYLYSETCS